MIAWTSAHSIVRSTGSIPPTTSCTRWGAARTSPSATGALLRTSGAPLRSAGVRRIIYLGGLTDDTADLSAHLKSRAETGEALRASGVPVVEFRASIVIGAGSLSFQMIQALVERLPVMVCPRWVSTLTQPIAVTDVLAYLHAALDADLASSTTFEIGGPDVVSYGDMMRAYARLRGLRRWLIPVPFLTPHLSGLWLALVTPAQARVGRALVEGLKNSTVVRSNAARDVFLIDPVPLDAALESAINDGEAARLRVDSRADRGECNAGPGFRSHPQDWRRHRVVLSGSSSGRCAATSIPRWAVWASGADGVILSFASAETPSTAGPSNGWCPTACCGFPPT